MALPSLTLSSSSSSALLRQGYLFAYFEIFLDFLNEYTTYHYSVCERTSSPVSSSTLSSSSSSSGLIKAKMLTPDEIRWELETEHGLTVDEIPSILGGCWTHDAFDVWLRERMYHEQSRYIAGDHDDVDSLRDKNQNNDNNSGLLMEQMPAVTVDTYIRDRRHRFSIGRSSKRSKRDQYFSGWIGQVESCPPGWMEEKEEESDDGKSHAVDKEQTIFQQRRHISDQQQEHTQESEQDGSLDDLMKKFQQLLFRDSSTSASLPQQQQQQHVVSNTNLISPTSAVMPFVSGLNLLHPVALLEKVLDVIPISNKADFMTALQVAPRLVARESDPMRFLVFHDFDAQRAAEGLVHYWKIRRELFGDRAYLPMAIFSLDDDDAGGCDYDGALTAEDISLYRTGYSAIVGTDRQGSPVVLWDPSRLNTYSTTTRLRAGFYLYQVLSEYHTSQTQGLVVITMMRTINIDKMTAKITRMMTKTFPVKFKAIHSFDCMEKSNLFVRGFVQGLVGIFMHVIKLSKVHFYTSHCQREREQNVQLLEQHGLTRELLPCSIGGTWLYEKFDEWLVQRIQLEKQLHRFHLHMNDGLLAIASSPTDGPPISATPSTCCEHLQEASTSVPITQKPRSASSIAMGVHTIPENVQSLERATRHLPLPETKAFHDALQNANPSIWEEECNPELFLRVESHDTQKAAERMTKYWQLRCQTFGPKQYELLTQTGEDALGCRDVKILATGFLTLLPVDTHGQSILFVDLSRLRSNIGSNDCNRCLFYMMSLLTENEKSQSDGIILLHWVHAPNFALIDVSFLEGLIKTLPLKLDRIHIISYDDIPAESVLPRVGGSEVYTHSGNCKESLCLELELFGMEKAGLPKGVNGDWGYEKFVQWQELRTRVEWKIPAGLSGRDFTNMASFPAMKSYTVIEDERERQRRLKLIHFRRRQNRDRVEIASLEDDCIALENEQKELLKENQDLEKRYAAASAVINSESEMMA